MRCPDSRPGIERADGVHGQVKEFGEGARAVGGDPLSLCRRETGEGRSAERVGMEAALIVGEFGGQARGSTLAAMGYRCASGLI